MAQKVLGRESRRLILFTFFLLAIVTQLVLVSAATQADFEEILQPIQTIYDLVKYTATVISGLVMLFAEIRAYGGLVSDDNLYREYNELGQLVRVRESNESGEMIEEYVYDPLGSRVKKYNAQKNETTYTPFREFMMVVNESGSYNFTYVYADGVLLAKINPDGSKYFYHPDHLGSTTLITNEAGEVVEETMYMPYGGVYSGGESEIKLYEGKELDDTGMYYYGARYYDLELRMFVQADTMLPDVYDPQQLNRYMFERGNPYVYTDPSGHSPSNFNNPIADFFDSKGTKHTYYAIEGIADESHNIFNNNPIARVVRTASAIIPSEVSVIASLGFASEKVAYGGYKTSSSGINNYYASKGVSGFTQRTNEQMAYYNSNIFSGIFDTLMVSTARYAPVDKGAEVMTDVNKYSTIFFDKNGFDFAESLDKKSGVSKTLIPSEEDKK